MICYLNEDRLTLEREPEDRQRFDNRRVGREFFDGDSWFLYHVKKALNTHGFDLIKKRMWKDRHLTDTTQVYLRTRSSRSKAPHVMIYNSGYAIESVFWHWNREGSAQWDVVFDCFGVQPDARERALLALGQIPELFGCQKISGQIRRKEL